MPRSTFEIENSKPYFIFMSFFDYTHGNNPKPNIYSTHFYSNSPFSKFGNESCPPSRKGGMSDTVKMLLANVLFLYCYILHLALFCV